MKFHRDVAALIEQHDLTDPVFAPTLEKLIDDLQSDPKQFSKKAGKLKTARAAPIRFNKANWRAVFTLCESERFVLIIALGPHDVAYTDAARRIAARRK